MGEMLGGRGMHERGPQAAAQQTSRCWALEQLAPRVCRVQRVQTLYFSPSW